jgi:hypothetical protein
MAISPPIKFDGAKDGGVLRMYDPLKSDATFIKFSSGVCASSGVSTKVNAIKQNCKSLTIQIFLLSDYTLSKLSVLINFNTDSPRVHEKKEAFKFLPVIVSACTSTHHAAH